jgi:xylulokinase
MPQPGWAEHDAECVWWDELVAICGELLPQAHGRVAAVGVSGIGPCVVPCDANDVPLRPAILYGIDTRAVAEIDELSSLLGSDEILRLCGSALSTQALGPKLAWLRRNEPDVWAATARWHMASSFVVSRLTGSWVLDHHSASQCDPLYDLDACAWHLDWAEAVVPGLPMPELAWPAEVVGTVHARGAEATGIPAGTPVVAGTIDCWAEAASVGVRATGDLMLQYGSTVFLVLGTASVAGHPGLWTTRGVDPGSLTVAAGLATAGSLIDWLRDLVGGAPFEVLLREADLAGPGAAGLLVLPYFAGERTPILDPYARGTITGLTLRHTRGDLYRAVLEGIALGIRHNLEAMEAPADLHAVAVGGGTNADLWLQIVSDAAGLMQEIPAVTVGACYGDALLAGEGAGIVAPSSSWARTDRLVSPDPANMDAYDALYELYRELYPATRELQHALAELQLGSRDRGGLPTADHPVSDRS